MRIARKFTNLGQGPYAGIAFKTVNIEICHADPSQRVCIPNFKVPAHWSYAACEFLARHYLRKRDVPMACVPVAEEMVPEWLRRSEVDESTLQSLPEDERYGSETSATQLFHRIAGAWAYWGWSHGYFDTEEDARAFYDESCYMMAMQMAAPASPQWLNTGLHWAYGLDSKAQGHFYVDTNTGQVQSSDSAYERPQHHHHFIQSVKDELVSDGGIMDLWEREARAFKYGSGAGCNMSAIRSAQEELSSGTSSVGLMRFLSIGDKAAAAVKSGGNALKVDKLVVVDIDHPEVESFIRWKMKEEHKAAALVTGARQMHKHLARLVDATRCNDMNGDEANRYSPTHNPKLKHAMRQARRAMIPESYITRILDYARQGFSDVVIPLYGTEEGSDVFMTVGAHQTHMAVRVSEAFLQTVEEQKPWALTGRRDGKMVNVVDSTDLFDQLAQASWATGDPVVQFDDSINMWNTCAKDGAIEASSPRSEFLFLNDTACDVAALNLLRFVSEEGAFDCKAFEHASRLMSIMLDISVTMAQYPSREIAKNTYRYRPIALSYCNLGPMLMRMGYAYDSDEARSMAAAITALMSGVGYETSSDLAMELGAFEAFSDNRDSMLSVVRQHREAVYGRSEHLGSLHVMPTVLDDASLPDTDIGDTLRRVWDRAILSGEQYGFSNAQVSAIAATPNVASLLDAHSLSVSPEHSLVRLAPQAKGGFRKYVCEHVMVALKELDYKPNQIGDIIQYIRGTASLVGAPAIDVETLMEKGFTQIEVDAVQEALAHVLDVRQAFDPFIIGEAFCRNVLKLDDSHIYNASFDVLSHMGFSQEEIEAANIYACGAGEMTGAPHIVEEDVAVFDVAIMCAGQERYASIDSQIAMMSAVQPFVSGGISHQITVPYTATIDECREWMLSAWKNGLKSIGLYRIDSGLHDRVVIEDDEQSDSVIEEETVLMHPRAVATQLARETQARRELPLRRGGYTQKAVIGGQTVYLRTGEYSDGQLGEVFIDTPKQGEAFRGLVNQFAIAISVALQYGVPLESFVDAFRRSQFGPSGSVEGNPSIDTATSILDYIFRELSMSYLQSEDGEDPAPDGVAAQVLAWKDHVKQESEEGA